MEKFSVFLFDRNGVVSAHICRDDSLNWEIIKKFDCYDIIAVNIVSPKGELVTLSDKVAIKEFFTQVIAKEVDRVLSKGRYIGVTPEKIFDAI